MAIGMGSGKLRRTWGLYIVCCIETFAFLMAGVAFQVRGILTLFGNNVVDSNYHYTRMALSTVWMQLKSLMEM